MKRSVLSTFILSLLISLVGDGFSGVIVSKISRRTLVFDPFIKECITPASVWNPDSRRFVLKGLATVFLFRGKIAKAQSYEREIGDFSWQPIDFSVFDPASLTADNVLRQVLEEWSQYIRRLKTLMDDAVAQKKNVSPADEARFELERVQMALRLFQIPEVRRLTFEQAVKMGLTPAAAPVQLVQQILYFGVPAFFGSRGLLLGFGFRQPSSQDSFTPNITDHHLLEGWSLAPILSKEIAPLALWGNVTEAPEMMIDVPLVYNDMVMETAPLGLAGQTIYQAIAFFEKGQDLSAANSFAFSQKRVPEAIGLRSVEWEYAAARSAVFRNDPLLYTYAWFSGEQINHPLSLARQKARIRRQVRAHERQHYIDAMRKRYEAKGGQIDWAQFQREVMGPVINKEVDGYITQLREAAPEERFMELSEHLGVLQDKQDPNNRIATLIHYNFIDQIVSYLEINWRRFPELRIAARADISLRAQIGGQLYRLTPQSLARLADGLHAAREENLPEAKQPTDLSLRSLVQGRPYLGPNAPAAPKPPLPRRAVLYPMLLLKRHA